MWKIHLTSLVAICIIIYSIPWFSAQNSGQLFDIDFNLFDAMVSLIYMRQGFSALENSTYKPFLPQCKEKQLPCIFLN